MSINFKSNQNVRVVFRKSRDDCESAKKYLGDIFFSERWSPNVEHETTKLVKKGFEKSFSKQNCSVPAKHAF